jgi:hypothetical protein
MTRAPLRRGVLAHAVIGLVLPWFGLDLPKLARSVAALDLAGHGLGWLTETSRHRLRWWRDSGLLRRVAVTIERRMAAPSPRSPLVTPGWFRRHSASARRHTQTDVRLIEPLVEPLAKLRDRSGPSRQRPSGARPASHAVPMSRSGSPRLLRVGNFRHRPRLSPHGLRDPMQRGRSGPHHSIAPAWPAAAKQRSAPRREAPAAPMRLVAGKTPCTVRMHRRCRLQFTSARIVAGKTPCT